MLQLKITDLDRGEELVFAWHGVAVHEDRETVCRESKNKARSWS